MLTDGRLAVVSATAFFLFYQELSKNARLACSSVRELPPLNALRLFEVGASSSRLPVQPA